MQLREKRLWSLRDISAKQAATINKIFVIHVNIGLLVGKKPSVQGPFPVDVPFFFPSVLKEITT